MNNSPCKVEWEWDFTKASDDIVLKHKNLEVCFSPHWSRGTAAVRGNKPCVPGWNYYWEVEIVSQLYGTDVMVGVGTAKVDLKKYEDKFVSFLGSDGESWGYSYHGTIYHDGIRTPYGFQFGKGNVVGVRLDTWMGSLSFFLNSQPLGVAFTSLNGIVVYPMVCSTAACSTLRIVSAESFPCTLQLLCCQILSSRESLVRKLQLIPGLWRNIKKDLRYPSLKSPSKTSARRHSVNGSEEWFNIFHWELEDHKLCRISEVK